MSATNDERTKRILIALRGLFLSLPAQDRSGSEDALVRVYEFALEGIPAGIVEMACKRFVQGLVQRADLRFRPTTAELASEARRLQERALDRERIAMLPPRPPRRALPEPSGNEIPREMWEDLQEMVRRAVEASAIPREPRRFKGAHAPAEDRPKVDISDFPSATATRAEQRAWETRQCGSAGEST